MFSFGLYMYAYMYTPNTYTSPTHIRTHAHMHMPSTHTQSLISELLKKHIAIYSTNTDIASCRDSNGFIVLLMLSLCSFNLLYELGENAIQCGFYPCYCYQYFSISITKKHFLIFQL